MIRKFAAMVILSVAVVALLGACGDDEADAGEPVTLRMLSAWGTNNTSVESALEIYGPAISEATGGLVSLEFVAGPETVPVFEQVEPLKQGLFDIVLQTDGYNQINALAAGMNLNLAPYAIHKECGLIDEISRLYEERGNVKWFPQVHGFGNVLFLRNDVDPSNLTTLDGLTLRTYPTVDAFVKSRGGVPTVLAGGDTYTALDRGVVDGAISGSTDFGESLSWNEVAGRIVAPEIGATVANFLINIDVWNSFSEKTQEQIEEGIAKASAEHFIVSAAAQKDSLERMVADGLEVVQLSDSAAQAWADSWFEATSQSTVISRDAEEGPGIVEKAQCVKDKLEAA
jgi:TRAP-type C4-dicarboxylate transport system substrate-binding protein